MVFARGGILMSGLMPRVGFVAVILLAALSAAKITVRQDGTGDYKAISDAVASAAAGDSIDVGPGTYGEAVYVDKSLSIIGTSGLGATTVDGEDIRTPISVFGAITFHLEGITVARGFAAYPVAGGGVGIRNGAIATITGCHFADNRTDMAGGGVFLKGPGSRLAIDHCGFAGNHANGDGGAGYVTEGGTMDVSDCTFVANTADPYGAALGNYYSVLNVTGCLFADDSSTTVAGAVSYYRAFGNISNNTFYHNSSGYGDYSGTVLLHESPGTSVSYCIIAGDPTSYGLYLLDGASYHACNVYWDNALGPIAGDVLAPSEVVADPMFCAPMSDKFYLAESSPAAPANNVCGALIGA